MKAINATAARKTELITLQNNVLEARAAYEHAEFVEGQIEKSILQENKFFDEEGARVLENSLHIKESQYELFLDFVAARFAEMGTIINPEDSYSWPMREALDKAERALVDFCKIITPKKAAGYDLEETFDKAINSARWRPQVVKLCMSLSL